MAATDSGTTIKCTICMEDQTKYHTLPCHHQYCADCLQGHFSLAAREKDLSRLVCPTFDCRCSLAAPEHMALIRDIVGKNDCSQIEAALNAQLLQCNGYYSCPKCGVKGFSEPSAGTCVSCSKCKYMFCCRCRSDLYHYNLPHDERGCDVAMREKEAAWLSFCSGELGEILEEKASKEAAGRKTLAEFRKKQKEQETKLKIFERDENAKKDWVHCPHCKTLWSGSDACPEVTCGVLEANMGEIRGVVGCGKKFNLEQAEKYKPAKVPARKRDLPELSKATPDEVRHGKLCDKCHTQITGIRLRCLNCPNYNLCVSCLAKHGQGHAAQRPWPRKTHTFDIIRKPNASHQGAELSNHLADISEEDWFEIAAMESFGSSGGVRRSSGSQAVSSEPSPPAKLRKTHTSDIIRKPNVSHQGAELFNHLADISDELAFEIAVEESIRS